MTGLRAGDIHCKQANNSCGSKSIQTGASLYSCPVIARSPVSHTLGTGEDVRRRYLEAICQRTGHAHLEASAAMARLHLLDPQLSDAGAPELLNALELVNLPHIAMMHRTQDSQRYRRPRSLEIT